MQSFKTMDEKCPCILQIQVLLAQGAIMCQNTTAITLRSKFRIYFFSYNGTKLEVQIISGKYLFYIAKRKNTVVLASDTLFTYNNHCKSIGHYKLQ